MVHFRHEICMKEHRTAAEQLVLADMNAALENWCRTSPELKAILDAHGFTPSRFPTPGFDLWCDIDHSKDDTTTTVTIQVPRPGCEPDPANDVKLTGYVVTEES